MLNQPSLSKYVTVIRFLQMTLHLSFEKIMFETHSVEIVKNLSFTLFWQKFRGSNVCTEKITNKLISRFFFVTKLLVFSHCVSFVNVFANVPSTTIKSSSSMPSTPSIMSKVSKIISSASSTVLNSQNTTTLQWSCAKCTFLNHPCLQLCEQCEMPRFPEINNSKECICHDDTTTTTTNNSTNNCANHAAIIQ